MHLNLLRNILVDGVSYRPFVILNNLLFSLFYPIFSRLNWGAFGDNVNALESIRRMYDRESLRENVELEERMA
jgi:hypothetical protein